MGAGAFAELLAGECIRKNVMAGVYSGSNIVFPFRQISVYSIIGTVGGNNQEASTCGCGVNKLGDGTPSTTVLGTEPLPVGSLPSGTTSRGVIYGRFPANTYDVNNNPVKLTALNGSPVWFKDAEFNPWRRRSKYASVGNTGYRTFASGPPLKHGILCMSLRRRLKRKESHNNRDYRGRMAFDFIAAKDPVYGQSDWLGPFHPAGYFWTNESVPEPFLLKTHYEDAGSSPKTDTESAFKFHIPFCNPMPVYKQDGTSLGNYTGYTMQHFFSMGFVHFGEAKGWVPDPGKPGSYKEENVFLPDDYRSPVNPQTGKHTMKVMVREQLFSLSSYLFMTSDNPALGSPLIAGTRYWWYNNGQYVNEPFINAPYLCGFVSPIMAPNAWIFPVEFNIIGKSDPERILICLEPISTYVAA